MQIPQIQIRQQYAKINLQTFPAKLDIKQSKPQIQISQPKGDLEINSRPAIINIDNYPMNFDIGLKNVTDFSKENAETGYQNILETIGRYAQQGDQLMSIEHKGKALFDIVAENVIQPEKQINIKWARGPKFNVVPHELRIKYTQNKPIINSHKIPNDFNYTRGRVDITMAQYHKVDISVVGGIFDQIV